jgi:lipase ATG15
MEIRKSRRRQQCSVGTNPAKVLFTLLAFSAVSPVTAWTGVWGRPAHQAPLVPPSPLPKADPQDVPVSASWDHEFTLRHVFYQGTYEYPELHRRLNVHTKDRPSTTEEQDDEELGVGPYSARSHSTHIERLSDRRIEALEPLMSAGRHHGRPHLLPPSAWNVDEVLGPNITDRETIINLALMTANAYNEVPGDGEWEDPGAPYNRSLGFGWEGDSLRGHVFADKTNSTIVIAIKGTSPAVFDGADTTTNDKMNDNLFFGCCCGQGGQYLWRAVCDCRTATYTCNETCVTQALRGKHRYYQASIELYGNITEVYPNSNVWLTGHSLGGSVSSLLGLTFGLPVVAFEAPPEAMAASRLGLPSPPNAKPGRPQSRKNTGIWHFGHTADPMFMGTCNAATSACTLGGYALESQCHLGQRCVYDVVTDKGWRVSATRHSIRAVIRDVLRVYETVPACEPESEECVDCFNWKHFESNGSDSTTSTSTSTTTSYTRTETCKTPGWWGCLDEETTTSGKTTSTSTTTSTTVTCTHYGWFGGCESPFELRVLSNIKY